MRSVSFGPFCLQLHCHPHDRHRIIARLFCNGERQHVQPKQLELLRFLADDHPGEEVTVDEIALALWPLENKGDNVEKQISLLRAILGDNDKFPKFIARIADIKGYKFIARVHTEGDLDRLDGSTKWDPVRFHNFMDQVGENEELRIVATGLPYTASEFPFDSLLKRGVKIKIVLMRPENAQLVEGRHALREDKSRAVCLAELKDQIKQLPTLATTLREEGGEAIPGTIECRVSDAMPCGFVVHARHGALLGIYLAHCSYTRGPMLEIPPGTQLWKELHHDWQNRWDGRPKVGPNLPAKKRSPE